MPRKLRRPRTFEEFLEAVRVRPRGRRGIPFRGETDAYPRFRLTDPQPVPKVPFGRVLLGFGLVAMVIIGGVVWFSWGTYGFWWTLLSVIGLLACVLAVIVAAEFEFGPDDEPNKDTE